MENGSESARQEKRRSVQAAGAFRYCPLPEHAEKSAGRRPVSRFREVVPRHGNLGGNTESFRPNSKGEKAFYFLLRRKKYMLDLKFLRENFYLLSTAFYFTISENAYKGRQKQKNT